MNRSYKSHIWIPIKRILLAINIFSLASNKLTLLLSVNFPYDFKGQGHPAYVNYILTNSIKHSPSWEANSSEVASKISPRICWTRCIICIADIHIYTFPEAGNFTDIIFYRVSQNCVNTNGLWYHLFPAKCVSGFLMVLLLAGYCVLNTTANRLRPSCKSSCKYHVCFVNKLFLQFKC